MQKRIVIFGSTGGTGQELVTQALKGNYRVTAFARSPEKLNVSDTNLKVIQGDVLNLEDVCRAVENQDVVLCSIGMPDSDKSMLRTKGTVNIIKAMEKQGMNRLICQSTLGIGDSKVALPWLMKFIIVPLILKTAFKDHEIQESKIENAKLDWTIVRPAGLTNGKKTGRYKQDFAYSDKIKGKVSRADTAHFMLNQIDDNQYFRQKVGISY
jgi:putative NADH-flavin reductase